MYIDEVRVDCQRLLEQIDRLGKVLLRSGDDAQVVVTQAIAGIDPPVGSQGETYKTIDTGVKELQDMVKSRSSKADLMKKIDEMIALTDGLP